MYIRNVCDLSSALYKIEIETNKITLISHNITNQL